MPRKIYDIKPPKVVKKIEKDIQTFLNDAKIMPASGRGKKSAGRHKKENHSIWLPVLIIILSAIIIVCIYLFFKLPKADVVIWPKVDALSFKQTITADKSANSVDFAKSVIPAQFFQATKTNSQNFPATGNADNTGKASGVVTIYNKCDPPSPISIAKGINFLSNYGKVFTTSQKKFVIPAATKQGSKITPSSIQMKVEAADAGESYNIAPANFSAPGLNGTVYFSCIYATSTSPMAGGYSGKVKKVTDDDIQGAKDVLTKKTTSDAISALKNQISPDYVLFDNAILSNVSSASTQTKSGAIAPDFNYQVTVTANTLAFKKSDIDQFVKNYIASQIPAGKTLLDNSLKTDYSASIVDVSGGKATLNLDFSSGVYQDVDKNSLTLSLLGENAGQIKETVNNRFEGQVSNIQINFWPFWVASAPNSQSAVNVEMKFQ